MKKVGYGKERDWFQGWFLQVTAAMKVRLTPVGFLFVADGCWVVVVAGFGL